MATVNGTEVNLAPAQLSAEFDQRFAELYVIALRPAQRILADRTKAEDVASETLARAWERWAKLRSHPALGPWVARVATNLALDQAKRRLPLPLRSEPRDEIGYVDRLLELTPALSRLPRRQRQVVALHYFAELTDAEVAAALGISITTVRTHLQRALGALRIDLASERENHDHS